MAFHAGSLAALERTRGLRDDALLILDSLRDNAFLIFKSLRPVGMTIL
jgi:hypothetical protein